MQDAAEPASADHDLTIIGVGLLHRAHLTLEAQALVRAARVVMFSAYNAQIKDDLRGLNPRAEFLMQEQDEYEIGMFRPQMYQRIAEAVAGQAQQAPGVVSLHPGSAVVVDSITQALVRLCHERSLSLRIIPGVSAVEAVLTQVHYDVADGVQIILAQKLILHTKKLNPQLAAVIIQPGYYDTLYFAGAAHSKRHRFDRLQQTLCNAYGENHPACLTISPMHDEAQPTCFWFRLQNLSQLSSFIGPFHTLFIPPSEDAENNPQFEQRINSWPLLTEHIHCDRDGTPRQQSPGNWFNPRIAAVEQSLITESTELAQAWDRKSHGH